MSMTNHLWNAIAAAKTNDHPEQREKKMKDAPKPPPEFPAVAHTGKKISPEDRKAIIDLSADYSPRKIAPRVGLSRKIVCRVLLEEGILHPKRRLKQKKLDAFYPKVAELVEKELTVTRILREIQELGYQGSRTILGEHVGRVVNKRGKIFKNVIASKAKQSRP
jgi:hypothetical protein